MFPSKGVANHCSGQTSHKLHYQWSGVGVTRTTGPGNTLYGCKEVSRNRNGQFTVTYAWTSATCHLSAVIWQTPCPTGSSKSLDLICDLKTELEISQADLTQAFLRYKCEPISMADPGFPRGGGCQHTILPNFPKNCMKLKEFGPPGGAPPP